MPIKQKPRPASKKKSEHTSKEPAVVDPYVAHCNKEYVPAVALCKNQTAERKKEIAFLQTQIRQKGVESTETVAFLQREIDKQEYARKAAVVALKQRKAVGDLEMQQLEEKQKAIQKSVIRKCENEEADLLAENYRLKSELGDLASFKESKRQWTESLESAHKNLATLKNQHESTVHQMQRSFVIDAEKAKQEAASQLERIKHTCKEEAESIHILETQHLREENIRLTDKLRKQKSYINQVKEENENTKAQAKRLRLEVELSLSRDEESQKRISKQKARIRRLGDKAKTLEKELHDTLEDLDLSRVKWLDLDKDDLDSARLEVEGLKQLLKMKAVELQEIRQHARQVVTERDRVEWFLKRSLSLVKEEMDKISANEVAKSKENMRRQIRLANKYKNVKFPEIHSNHDVTLVPPLRSTDELVSYSQLALPEKEKLIRLLFARLSAGQEETVLEDYDRPLTGVEPPPVVNTDYDDDAIVRDTTFLTQSSIFDGDLNLEPEEEKVDLYTVAEDS